MLKFINPEYCNENIINLSLSNPYCHLIITDKELIFLKNKGQILYNKHEECLKHPFEYNTNYLSFIINNEKYRFENFYFTKHKDQTICFNENIPQNGKEEEIILTKKEIKDYFNEKNYDSLYLIDKESKILYAKDNKEGILIDKEIIPSDKKIIKLHQGLQNKKEKTINHILPNYVQDIKNISIYDKGKYSGYYTLLVTSKNKNIDINWFGLEYLEKDQFKLTLIPVPNTVDENYVQDQIKKFGVYYTITNDKLDTQTPLIKTK